MWLGRYTQGDWLPLLVRTATTTVVAPTAAPVVSIYDATDTEVLDSGPLAPRLAGALTGVFGRLIRLGSSYPAGRYTARISWSSGGNAYASLQTFEVVTGAAGGAVTGLAYYSRPQRDYLVLLQDGGALTARTNPRL